jgi:hypothetical protein
MPKARIPAAMGDNPAMVEPTPSLQKSDKNLVWLDCEMSGLQPDRERLLELAIIVTGPDLEPRIEGPVLVIHQSDALLDKMDAWNRGTHAKSGLIDKVKRSVLTEAQAEQQLLDFVGRYVPRNASPLCGNTISQDRRFLARGARTDDAQVELAHRGLSLADPGVGCRARVGASGRCGASVATMRRADHGQRRIGAGDGVRRRELL